MSEVTLRYQLMTAVFYGFCSGSMNFLNKNVLSSWDFHYPRFLMLFQMIFLAIGIDLLKLAGLVRAHNYTLSLGKSCWQISLFFALNTTIALFALTGMNIPMYNAMRRCTPIVSLIIGPCLLRSQKPTIGIWLSILLITIGTFVAAFGDLNFHWHSYCLGIASVITQALYLLTLQKTGIEKNIGAISLVYINSINCMPVMTIICFLAGDISAISKYPNWHEPWFLTSFLFLVFWGCVFTYSMFLCTTTNSALTTALVSTAKSAITTVVGMYTFGGVEPTVAFVLGQILNFAGGCLYSFIKFNQRKSVPATNLTEEKVHSTSLPMHHAESGYQRIPDNSEVTDQRS